MTANARRSERLVIHLRWAVMLTALISLWPQVPAARLLAPALFLAAYNGAALRLVLSAQRRPGWWRFAAIATRAFDLALATAIILMAPAPARLYHALYLFPVVATGYVRPNVRTVLIAAGAAAFACLGVSWLSAGPRSLLLAAGPVAAVGLAALWGWFLGQERQRADEATRRQRKLDAIARLNRELRRARADSGETSPPLAEAMRVALKAVGARSAALLVRPAENAEGAHPSPHSEDPREHGNLEISLQVGEDIINTDSHNALARHAVASGQPVLLSERGGQAALCVPLVTYRAGSSGVSVNTIGALLLAGSAEDAAFGDDDLAAAEMLSVEIAFMLVQHTLYEQLKNDFRRTIMSLARTLEARGQESPGHGGRVANLCEILGRAFGLPGRVIGMMREAAHLHDIGKIALPDAVLSKPGSLSPQEWQAIRAYPVVSEDICRPLGLEPEVLFLIRHHMERLDGSGYPDGLKGEQQPLPLRILCVAAAFDAMSLDRPHRPALAIEQRLQELSKRAGIEFDQEVVEALQSLVAEGRLASLYDDAFLTGEPALPAPQDRATAPSSPAPAQAEEPTPAPGRPTPVC